MKKVITRHWKFMGILTVLLSFTMVFFTSNTANAGSNVVRIGNIIPLSGPSASVGEQGKNAREMAVEDLNPRFYF